MIYNNDTDRNNGVFFPFGSIGVHIALVIENTYVILARAQTLEGNPYCYRMHAPGMQDKLGGGGQCLSVDVDDLGECSDCDRPRRIRRSVVFQFYAQLVVAGWSSLSGQAPLTI